jgi:hypothetical protein
MTRGLGDAVAKIDKEGCRFDALSWYALLIPSCAAGIQGVPVELPCGSQSVLACLPLPYSSVRFVHPSLRDGKVRTCAL